MEDANRDLVSTHVAALEALKSTKAEAQEASTTLALECNSRKLVITLAIDKAVFAPCVEVTEEREKVVKCALATNSKEEKHQAANVVRLANA